MTQSLLAQERNDLTLVEFMRNIIQLMTIEQKQTIKRIIFDEIAGQQQDLLLIKEDGQVRPEIGQILLQLLDFHSSLLNRISQIVCQLV